MIKLGLFFTKVIHMYIIQKIKLSIYYNNFHVLQKAH